MSRYLPIYLRDHHAAGSAGARLARRVAENVNPEIVGQPGLSAISEEIAADLRTLEAIMAGEGVEPSRVKDAAAIAAGELGQLKSNGHLRRRSPLSDVIELETLMIGIKGKAALWKSLAEALPHSEVDFEALQERAARQLLSVSRCRDDAALRAFRKGEPAETSLGHRRQSRSKRLGGCLAQRFGARNRDQRGDDRAGADALRRCRVGRSPRGRRSHLGSSARAVTRYLWMPSRAGDVRVSPCRLGRFRPVGSWDADIAHQPLVCERRQAAGESSPAARSGMTDWVRAMSVPVGHRAGLGRGHGLTRC